MYRLILLALAVVLGLAALFYSSGGNTSTGGAVFAGSVLEDVRVVNRRGSEMVWSMGSESAVLSEDGTTASMSSVTVELPSEGMTVRSQSGLYRTDTNDLKLSGNITVTGKDFSLRTDEISLKSPDGGISTDDPVLIEGKGFRIEGKGLRAIDNKVSLLSDVKAIFF